MFLIIDAKFVHALVGAADTEALILVLVVNDLNNVTMKARRIAATNHVIIVDVEGLVAALRKAADEKLKAPQAVVNVNTAVGMPVEVDVETAVPLRVSVNKVELKVSVKK